MSTGPLNVLINKVRTHCNERPKGSAIDTVIIHSISNPGCDKPFLLENCLEILDEHQVSSHYMIGRRGEVITLIDETARAYHAGLSLMPLEVDRRENVNNFSIGIELIGSDRDKFTKRQYDSLSKLMLGIINRHPIRYVLGHEHVAPGRKTDPGPGFDWQRLIALKDSFSELILPQDLRNPWG